MEHGQEGQLNKAQRGFGDEVWRARWGMSSEMKTWRQSLEAIESLGKTTAKAASLGEMAEVRKRNLSQFFTPLSVVKLMWKIAGEAISCVDSNRKIRLMDNSCGTGRMFEFATPDRFNLYGLDVHAESSKALAEMAEAAGFHGKIATGSMADLEADDMDISLLNPPFSIPLHSPNLSNYMCTSFGKFGPGTSARSDLYALAQALACSDVVIAVLPASALEEIRNTAVLGEDALRLAAVLRLPWTQFKEEGAQVSTGIAVFARSKQTAVHESEVGDVATYEPPRLGLKLGKRLGHSARFLLNGEDSSEPVVTLEPSGDELVRVYRHGRQIRLAFKCGATQGAVMNAVYRTRVYSDEHHRLPKGVKYSGQGQLDIEAVLATEKPSRTFESLVETIKEAGGRVEVCKQLTDYLNKRIKRKPLELEPLAHWAQVPGNSSGKAIVMKDLALEPKKWITPVLKAGECTHLEQSAEGWSVSKNGVTRKLSADELRDHFTLTDAAPTWRKVHRGLLEAFPVQAQDTRRKALALGMGSYLWGYQLDDLVEIAMKPHGCVVAWMQGLGKARLAGALIMLRDVKHGAVVMPSYLVAEFQDRMRSAGIPSHLWKVIEREADTRVLAKINIISYETLRKKYGNHPRITFGKRLRNRFGICINDEGERLCNPDSAQSRAVASLNADTVYVFSGTPAASYAKDLLPVSRIAVGDGVLSQPFGLHHPMLMESNAVSMRNSARGVDVFRERHATFSWITNEYAETLSQGAKREIPVVRDAAGFRAWLGPFVKRRVHREPEVEASVRIPQPTYRTMEVAFDADHLGYYLTIADEFAHWYNKADPNTRANNLVVLLARISAVEGAANIPQRQGNSPAKWTGGLTSHQKAVADLAERFTREGRKSVVFATSPDQLRLYQSILSKRGLKSVLFHGEIEMSKRRQALTEQWREGDCPLLLATFGTLSAGYDLYEGERVILANRRWTPRVEDQAVFRLLRPQQTKDVEAWSVQLKGSIHEYQAQLVEWKRQSIMEGLDWGEARGESDEFLHIDTVLGRMVENLAALRQTKGYKLREALKSEFASSL